LLLLLHGRQYCSLFADVLAAESDFIMPTTDHEIQAALVSFGADFKKMKGDVDTAVRADLLAGLEVASYAPPRPSPAGCGSDTS
jgi:hypothetical protein